MAGIANVYKSEVLFLGARQPVRGRSAPLLTRPFNA